MLLAQCQSAIRFCVSGLFNIVLIAIVTILLLCVAFVCTHAVGCYKTISSRRIEQRINLKFLVKLRKTPTECFKLVKEVYGEDVMSRTQNGTNILRKAARKWRMIPRRDDLPQQGQMKTSLE